MPKKVILCVDDEKIVLDSLKSQLKRKYETQYHYEIASSAEEALEIIEEMNDAGHQILMIVSDWLMPGIKGDEFLIKVHQRYPDIVKLMLTGHADQKSIENAYERANLLNCINKPWVENELYEAIEEGLEVR